MSDLAESSCEDSETTKHGRDVMSEINRETDEEILKILKAKAPLHVMDIAKTADRHPITVDQTCARLHERGKIHAIGRGIYTITSDRTPRFGGNPRPESQGSDLDS